MNTVTGSIIGGSIAVHRALGPGLLESTYRRCLARELTLRGHVVRQEVGLPIHYAGEIVEDAYRIDLLVDEQVVVELKAVTELADIHHAQLLTYLRLGKFRVGLLLNFNVGRMIDGVHRKVAADRWWAPRESIWDVRS